MDKLLNGDADRTFNRSKTGFGKMDIEVSSFAACTEVVGPLEYIE